MKATVAFLLVLGVFALANAGLTYTTPFGYTAAGPLTYTAGALPFPYAGYNAGFYSGLGYNTFAGDYQLKLDTTLPGSSYASYPYAAAPTAYGYGVIKTV